jgi:hypothetical protein
MPRRTQSCGRKLQLIQPLQMFQSLRFRKSFDKALYFSEMTTMIDKAIRRLQSEKLGFRIYTASIWTDPNASVSAISFDSKKNSLDKVDKSNEGNKKYYDQYIEEGDLDQAELFKPIEETRVCNPADFELKNFEEIAHKSFPANWETKTNGKCWKDLEPALIQIGEIYFQKIKKLNIEEGFELSINSERDWYDKTWQ